MTAEVKDLLTLEQQRAWREGAIERAKSMALENAKRFAKLLDEARAAREAREGK